MKPIKTIKYETEEIANEYKEKNKHYKLIILIIASHNDHYDVFTKCWEEYMNKYTDVKSFFLYSDETIDSDILISKNAITYKYKEDYIPGILYKTIAGFFFCNKKMSYDYIVRSNLSSFIHIPRLLDYMEDKEKNNIVASNVELIPLTSETNTIALNETISNLKAIHENVIIPNNKIDDWKIYTKILSSFYNNEKYIDEKYFHFLAGSFFLISKDIIKIILYETFINNILLKDDIYTIPDDVAISALLQLSNYKSPICYNTVHYSHKCENEELNNLYNDKVFHIRNRTDNIHGHRDFDKKNYINQVKYFYNNNFEV